MAAAAVSASSSLACPLRRSTRLAHAHAQIPLPHRRRSVKYPKLDPDHDHDSSSSDPENELTPRALRALKRQRLALDPDGLPLAPRSRPKKRRKENTTPQQVSIPPSPPSIKLTRFRTKRQPLTHSHTRSSDPQSPPSLSHDSCHSPRSTATTHAAPLAPLPESIDDPAIENHPSSPTFHADNPPSKPDLSIPLAPISSSPIPDPLTPLTPLTPSPESSPSLPGHDRHPLPSITLPVPVTVPDPSPNHHQSATDPFTSQPLPPSLDPALDTLIPFDGFHPQFDPELSVQIPPPQSPPQLQSLQLQAQFHSFQQHQLYVPPNPVFVRDREINIWKLACQERVDCLLRRYGVDYIKALVESQARSVSRETRFSSSPTATITPSPSQTKFRLYTPASYTYSVSSWGSSSGDPKAFPKLDQADDPDPAWPMDDVDWADGDIDMEDEDEDDYEDEDDPAEGDTLREGEATLDAVQGLVITDTGTPGTAIAMDVDDHAGPATKPIPSSEQSLPPRSTPEPSLRPSSPIPPPLTPPTLPSLSSLHVPLLSEPPRSFMGRGTPPDRRRLIEWSSSGRFATNGIDPPLYLSPVPQRRATTDVDIMPMSIDPPIQPAPPQPAHTHGEWTSFLYSMLEGDGVGVGGEGHASEPTWYELGLASVPPVVPEPELGLPTTHTARTTTPAVSLEHPIDEGSNSSSTLRFALG